MYIYIDTTMQKSVIMGLLTLVTISSILATTNTYAQDEVNIGTPGDDDISSEDGVDFNDGGDGDDTISSDGGDDTNVGGGGDDTIDSGDGDHTNDQEFENIDDQNVGDNFFTGPGDGGDDTINSGDGDDRNVGDNFVALVMAGMIQ